MLTCVTTPEFRQDLYAYYSIDNIRFAEILSGPDLLNEHVELVEWDGFSDLPVKGNVNFKLSTTMHDGSFSVVLSAIKEDGTVVGPVVLQDGKGNRYIKPLTEEKETK
jgi:uncharacterized membrane protein